MIQLPEKRRIVLMGQAPGRKGDGDPLGGKIGKRLVELCDLEGLPQLDLKFERRNLLLKFPGKQGKGDKFPMGLATDRARQLTPGLYNRDVIFLGRKVGQAFGLLSVPWFSVIHHKPGTFTCCIAPHPSGVSLWWNDLANRLRARRFFTEVANGKFQRMRAVALKMALEAMQEIWKIEAAKARAKMERGEF